MKDCVKFYLMFWESSSFKLFDKLLTALDEKLITHEEYVDHYTKLINRDEDTIKFVIENFEDHTTKI